jgi:hypothetical protein
MRRSPKTDLSPLAVLLGLTAVLIYSVAFLLPALRIGFVTDDFWNLLAPALDSWRDLPAVAAHAVSQTPRVISQGFYFSIGKGLWGTKPAPWHAANLLIFCVDVLLLYGLLARTLRSRFSALVGSALFALSGALFYASVWVAGMEELLATGFVFAAFFAHVSAHLRRMSGGNTAWLEIPVVIFYVLALGCKETAFPLVAVVILFDLMATRRVTVAGMAMLLCGIAGFIVGLPRLNEMETEVAQYSISTNPVSLLGNLFLYFYEPVIATGGDYWIFDRIGVTAEHKAAVLNNLLTIAKTRQAVSIAILCLAVAVGAFWLWFTLKKRRHETSEQEKVPLVGPAFGWLAWLIMLSIVLIIPGHHYPYYLTQPLGFLMVAVAPALAQALKNRRWRVPVMIGLMLYVAWYPINTRLAFDLSSVTQRARLADALHAEVVQVHREIAPGTIVVLDGADHETAVAIGFGRAFKAWYPGTEGMAFANLRERLENRRSQDIPTDRPVVIFRIENGAVSDVTPEFAAMFEKQ